MLSLIRYLATRQKMKRFLRDYAFLRNMNIRVHTDIDLKRIVRFIQNCRPVELPQGLIRIGPKSDGGYVLVNDLDGIDACFSPGVSTIADFELELAERGIPCFLADYSVEREPVSHSLFHFQKKYLGNETKREFISLPDWVEQCCPLGKEFILQMDIEGAEVAVILGTPSSLLRRFRQIIIEFHWLEHMLDPAGLYAFEQMFDKLLEDFDVVHIHPNNVVPSFSIQGIAIPQFVEFTFFRKERGVTRTPAKGPYPLKIDYPNVLDQPDVVLHPVWYDDELDARFLSD